MGISAGEDDPISTVVGGKRLSRCESELNHPYPWIFEEKLRDLGHDGHNIVHDNLLLNLLFLLDFLCRGLLFHDG